MSFVPICRNYHSHRRMLRTVFLAPVHNRQGWVGSEGGVTRQAPEPMRRSDTVGEGAGKGTPHEELLEALVDRLRAEGVPAGSWLVEIAQARQSLALADSLLRRLAESIVAQSLP